jgi:branched-chain amino acid transport system permease protein
MLGAFVTWYAMTKAGLPYPLAIIVAIVTLAALGALMQSAMMGLVMTQNLTSLMIVTLGLGYVLQGGSALIFGGNPQTLPGTLSRAKVDLGSLWFTWQDVLVLVATLALYGAVWLFMRRTRFGSVIRAVAEDPKLAELFGINAKVVYLLVFVFECSAVALGAALVAPRSPILTSMGFNEVIMTFVVVVLGGIGSIGGALVAGLGLGMFIAFFGAFIAQAYTTAAAFAVLLALLVIRPAGLATK